MPFDEPTLTTAPKTGFPWSLAIKLGLETTAYTFGLGFLLGATTLLLETTYDRFGLTGDILIITALALLLSLSENTTALWALALPVLERWLAALRARLGL